MGVVTKQKIQFEVTIRDDFPPEWKGDNGGGAGVQTVILDETQARYLRDDLNSLIPPNGLSYAEFAKAINTPLVEDILTWKALAISGRKIEAIKVLRTEKPHLGLAGCKNEVEAFVKHCSNFRDSI